MFVVIRGMTSISNTLLKWCAEYTKKTPWCYVYLEDVDLTWNFVEILDRIYPHPNMLQLLSDNNSSLNCYLIDYPDVQNSNQHLYRGSPQTLFSQFEKRWTAQGKSLDNSKWLLLNGVPGIGKTVEAKKIEADYKSRPGCVVEYLCCY